MRNDRSFFLAKIDELQRHAQALRDRGAADLEAENRLMRAQLAEHVHFVSDFRRITTCVSATPGEGGGGGGGGALPAATAPERHVVYQLGADLAHAYVTGLVAQSVCGHWERAVVPRGKEPACADFAFFYKFAPDYDDVSAVLEGSESAGEDAATRADAAPRRMRLNVRLDATFPDSDASYMSSAIWDAMADSEVLRPLSLGKRIELKQLEDDLPDRDTKLVYCKEPPRSTSKRSQDYLLLCNRRQKEIAASALAPPGTAAAAGRVLCHVAAISTTQHQAVPELPNAVRVTSLCIQGGLAWASGADARICAVLSIPDDLGIPVVPSIHHVVNRDTHEFTPVFADFICTFVDMMTTASAFMRALEAAAAAAAVAGAAAGGADADAEP